MKPFLLIGLTVCFLTTFVSVTYSDNNSKSDMLKAVSTSAAQDKPANLSSPAAVIGNKDTKRYHLPGMPFYNKVKKHHRVYFKSEQQAIENGYYKAGTGRDVKGMTPAESNPLEKQAGAAEPVVASALPIAVAAPEPARKEQAPGAQVQEIKPASSVAAGDPGAALVKPQDKLLHLTLRDCLEIAFAQSRLRAVSNESVKIAETQLAQAQSGHWPQMKLGVTAVRMDEEPMFVFPSVFPSQPPINVKLLDRDLLTGTLSVIYPLYTGGKISSLNKQAKIGVEVSKVEARRTDLQIARDVKQYFYGHILARHLHRLGRETLARFEATETITESVYLHGSGKVKKTDYLRTKMMTSAVRSVIEELKSNEDLSLSALGNAMGVAWSTPLAVAETEIPFTPYDNRLDALVADAHRHNPLMNQVRLGLSAREEKITEARSGHLPIVALFGNLNRLENSYEGGLSNDENRNSWQVGMALELPIFNGFRTTKEVQEAKHRLEKLKYENMLLSEGVALQVKHAFLMIARSQGQVKTMKEALATAVENRELNVRAYAQEMVETKDVIESQLMEFAMHVLYLKALYDHQLHTGSLEYIVGSSVYESR